MDSVSLEVGDLNLVRSLTPIWHAVTVKRYSRISLRVELTIQQSSFKIRSQVLNNRVKNHQTGSSFRATDQKLKILRSSFTFCAIEFYTLCDRV